MSVATPSVESQMAALLEALSSEQRFEQLSSTSSSSSPLSHGAHNGATTTTTTEGGINSSRRVEVDTPPPTTEVTQQIEHEAIGESDGLGELMNTYLGAVKRIRQLDAEEAQNNNNNNNSNNKTQPIESSNDQSSLEKKLSSLMAALNDNGTDAWPQKPEQAPLEWESLKAEAHALLLRGEQGGEDDEAEGGEEEEELEIEVCTMGSKSAVPTGVEEETPFVISTPPPESCGAESLESLVSHAMRLLREEQQLPNVAAAGGSSSAAAVKVIDVDPRSMEDLLAELDALS